MLSFPEAEYTYKLQKAFIPLRLEYKYNPDGWLGIMIGTKLWFDFSVETKFEASLQGLVREIGTEKQAMQKQNLPGRLASKRKGKDRYLSYF